MPKLALPIHLQSKNHSDWIFPFSLISRGANSFGPRIPEGKFGHLPWPPKLVKGYNVPIWEWSDLSGNSKKIFIPDFVDKKLGPDIYDQNWKAIFSNHRSEFVNLKAGWWPSIIPDDGTRGWLLTEPWHYAAWDLRPGWKRFYTRVGARQDFEMYYNLAPIPYIGRNPE